MSDIVERLRNYWRGESDPDQITDEAANEIETLHQKVANRDFLIADYQKQIEMLRDPVVVHLNMLRGGIAKPSWENIKHVYPEQFRDEVLK